MQEEEEEEEEEEEDGIVQTVDLRLALRLAAGEKIHLNQIAHLKRYPLKE